MFILKCIMFCDRFRYTRASRFAKSVAEVYHIRLLDMYDLSLNMEYSKFDLFVHQIGGDIVQKTTIIYV